MNEWPLGLSTGCFSDRDLADCLEDVLRSGFDLIEICSYPQHLRYDDREAVRGASERLRSLGLEAYSFHAPFAERLDVTTFDRDRRAEVLREMLLAVEAAATLEARYFVIHPGPESEAIPKAEHFERMENTAGVLDKVSRRCRELGLFLVLENKLPHLFSGHVRDLLWILGALQTVEVGICLDTGHAQLSGDLPTVVQKLSGHLWMVHASDNRGRFDDHLPPGDGDINWRRLFGQLAGGGFSGTVILEIAAGSDTQDTLARASRGRRYLRKVFREIPSNGWLGEPGGPSGSGPVA